MCFQDVSRAVVGALFRINTAVMSYKRLVYSIGTPDDSFDLRQQIRTMRLQIRELVRETSAQLDHIRETDKFFIKIEVIKKVADAKLAKDYEAALIEFEKAQVVAADREIDFPLSMMPNAVIQPICTEYDRRQMIMHFEDMRSYDEALIVEREQDIVEIEDQIDEANEIFQDLALLVFEQGGYIDHGIRSNATAEAISQVAQASNSRRSTPIMAGLMLAAIGILLVIVVVIFAK